MQKVESGGTGARELINRLSPVVKVCATFCNVRKCVSLTQFLHGLCMILSVNRLLM